MFANKEQAGQMKREREIHFTFYDVDRIKVEWQQKQKNKNYAVSFIFPKLTRMNAQYIELSVI